MDLDTCERACALLREARNVTYRWISEVGMKLDSAQDEASCADLRQRLCMLAATCFSTYDVSSEHIPVVLASEEDFSVAMQCAVIVHDNTPRSLTGLTHDNSFYLTRMLCRHYRLQHYLEAIFIQSLQDSAGKARLLHSAAYDDALARLWLGYQPRNFSSWHALPRPNSRWIFCITEKGKEVHCNLLTGELLIGGKRLMDLGRLPQEIVEHPTYVNLLGLVSDQY
jgi:hypothetical protein